MEFDKPLSKNVLFSASDIKIGNRYGKIVVLDMYKKEGRGRTRFIKYKCDCGTIGETRKFDITCGKTSCGCTSAKHNPKKHGFNSDNATEEQHALYTTYQGIRGRCERVKNNAYHNYGGRGIKCEWRTFGDFINDMWFSYKEHRQTHGKGNTTIERIDVNGNYNKENCIRVTRQEQGGTRRNSQRIEIDGKEYSTRELADKVGITVSAMSYRIREYKKGNMTLEVLLKGDRLTGYKNAKGVDIDGVHYSSEDISSICGIATTSANKRIRKYKDGEFSKEELFHKGKLDGNRLR